MSPVHFSPTTENPTNKDVVSSFSHLVYIEITDVSIFLMLFYFGFCNIIKFCVVLM